MNTMQLECFLAVAEHLNFSKAAQSVALTQPAVSHQIRALEEELGTALFTRTRKSVALTRAGLQFLGDASSILRIASTARARLSEPEAQSILFFGLGCHNYHEMELLPPRWQQISLQSVRPSSFAAQVDRYSRDAPWKPYRRIPSFRASSAGME